MSWDYKHVPAPVNRAAECRALVSDDYKVLKDALVGTTWYAAVQNKTTGEVRALIVLIHIDRKDHCNFGVNWMNELDGPYYYDCPKSILYILRVYHIPEFNILRLYGRICRKPYDMSGAECVYTIEEGSGRDDAGEVHKLINGFHIELSRNARIFKYSLDLGTEYDTTVIYCRVKGTYPHLISY